MPKGRTVVNLEPQTSLEAERLGFELEQTGQEAVAEAIAKAKASGVGVYYLDADGVLIMELPDGRRFKVENDSPNG
ncbi:MAG: hypothetical protein C4332_10950 [Meiothermus sp.]